MITGLGCTYNLDSGETSASTWYTRFVYYIFLILINPTKEHSNYQGRKTTPTINFVTPNARSLPSYTPSFQFDPMPAKISASRVSYWILPLGMILLPGCDTSPNDGPVSGEGVLDRPPSTISCSLDDALLNAPLGKDIIPALTNPPLVSADEADYLNEEDLILGIEIGPARIAIPHNILWHHEVANFTVEGTSLAVTYCPLTGSGLVFERADLNDAELGVSGLLYKNNLVLYDRRPEESLWPQMSRRAQCGPADALPLFSYPVLESTWEGWKSLHPTTLVVSGQTGFDRDYTRNPYGNYGIRKTKHSSSLWTSMRAGSQKNASSGFPTAMADSLSRFGIWLNPARNR